MSESFENRASDVYYNVANPASLGGPLRLSRSIDDRRGRLTRDWLAGQDAYTLHRKARRRFPRRKTIVSGPGVQLQADLMDVSAHADANDGVRFLLTAVDAFSRKGWAVPLANKGAAEVARGLREILTDSTYKSLQTDKGTEFRNRRVSELLRARGMRWFSSEDDVTKASLVERFNKTIRAKVHAYITHSREGEFVSRLPDMLRAYNTAHHRSLGMAPEDVNEENAAELFVRLYEPSTGLTTPKKAKFAVGDHVRTTKYRGAFARGFHEQWTREIFVVDVVRVDTEPVVYELKDLAGEKIEGTYYSHELQRVRLPDAFVIERVIRSRGRGERRQHLVKWLGYPESFNSWVSDADFV